LSKQKCLLIKFILLIHFQSINDNLKVNLRGRQQEEEEEEEEQTVKLIYIRLEIRSPNRGGSLVYLIQLNFAVTYCAI
jgi:hypothetical protein